jgi:hypothetical protein
MPKHETFSRFEIPFKKFMMFYKDLHGIKPNNENLDLMRDFDSEILGTNYRK